MPLMLANNRHYLHDCDLTLLLFRQHSALSVTPHFSFCQKQKTRFDERVLVNNLLFIELHLQDPDAQPNPRLLMAIVFTRFCGL